MIYTVFLIMLIKLSTQGYGAEVYEDAYLTVPELIKKYGYAIEIHHVTTKDGYILELHRIPPPSGRSSYRPVFLHHGIGDSSQAFVLLGPGKALGYLLSDLGFDVWLGNGRGNIYSKNHTVLNPDGLLDRRLFWDFSVHEMGVYDLPACIDYILAVASTKELYYVGHSQGCAEACVLLAEMPEYNKKVKAFFALAPAVYVNHMKSPLFRFEKLIGRIVGDNPLLLPSIPDILGHFDFVPEMKQVFPTLPKFCADPLAARTICSFPFYFFTGFSDQIEPSTVSIMYGHYPAGASTKQLNHYNQMLRSGIFRKYDYGRAVNLVKYQRTHPPSYRLENVEVPVYVYYSRNDWFCVPEDVEKLIEELPNLGGAFKVRHPDWTHVDFIYGQDSKKYVYNSIINILKNHASDTNKIIS